jgi:hypothetical protein
MLHSLSELITKAGNLKTDKEKIDWLKKNESLPLRTILKFTYNENIQFLLPNEAPKWKKNGLVGIEAMLYKEIKRLAIFIKGGGYDHLNQIRREQLFISLLESIDDKDAELVASMITKKDFPGLPKKLVIQTFPQDYG